MNCKNCGNEITGQFCAHCGQNSKVSKINLPNFISEVSDSVFQINRGLFFTVKELFIRPGYSIRDFIDGKRKNYFKPVAYVLLFSTVYFFLSRMIGGNTWINDAIDGFTHAAQDTNSGLKVPPILTWFSENFSYGTLILLPIFSLASFLLFFDLGSNYLEHVVLNSYLSGQQAIIYSILIVLKKIINSEYFFDGLPVYITFFYAVWFFWQFFSEGNRLVNVLRTLLTYILYTIITVFLFFGVMLIS